MEEEPLDLRAALSAISRHRLVVGLLVVLGVVAGTFYAARTRPMPEARAFVLLPPSAITGGPGPSAYTQTQEIIAKSSRVLSQAGAVLSPPVSAARLGPSVSVGAPSQDVMEIDVRASTMNDAERLANAVASSYIAYVDGTANGSRQLLSALQSEAASLTHKILSLQSSIDRVHARLLIGRTSPAQSSHDSALLGTLRTEQEQYSIQLNSINGQLVNAEVTTAQATAATQLLQRAQPVAPSSTRAVLIAALAGLAGLLAGVLLSLALAATDHHLRTRDALTSALGVPVVASMRSKQCRTLRDWRRLLKTTEPPSPVDSWNARRALQHLESASGKAQVLVFAEDRSAHAAVVRMVTLASLNSQSPVLEVGEHGALATLRAALVAGMWPAPASSSPEGPAGPRGPGRRSVVRLDGVDRLRPALNPFTDRTVLAVSSGFSTASDLAKVALATSDSGAPLSGVIVVNPDPSDSSLGFTAIPTRLETLNPADLSSSPAPRLVKRANHHD